MNLSVFNILFYRRGSKAVGRYYDHWSRRFVTVTDTLQGFRTKNINDTHAYTLTTARLAHGQTILDAGCGIGGPTFYFASHLDSDIHSLSISNVQIDIIKERASIENTNNISPLVGDYHSLETYFQSQFFDRVLFLESFGHSLHPLKVLNSCARVIKPGGILYIRDHFIRDDVQGDEKRHVEKLVREANRTYVYNHAYLDETLKLLEKTGFEVDLVRIPELEFWNINDEIEKHFGIKSPNGHFINTYEIRAVKS